MATLPTHRWRGTPGETRRRRLRCPPVSAHCSPRRSASRPTSSPSRRSSRSGCARRRCRRPTATPCPRSSAPTTCMVDDRGRLLRAGGKSTLDLLRRRDFGVQDAPDAVLVPGDDDEVAALLRFCADHGIAVVPFGGGTSVVGGLDPLRGDFKAVVALDLRRFDQLHALDEVSWEAELGAGLTGPQAERCSASAVSPSATSRRASASPPSAASRPPGPRVRTRRATAGSTTWSVACGPSPRPGVLDAGPGAGVGGRARSASGADGLRGRLRRHHPGPGARAPGPGGHPLRGVVVPRFRHRRRRAAGGGADRHRTDGDPTLRRSRDRCQPRHHREHRRTADHRRLPGRHGLRGHRGPRREPARRDARTVAGQGCDVAG